MVCQSRLNYANPSTDYVVSIGTQTGSGSYSWTIPAPSSTPVIGPLFPINDGTLLIERGVAKWSPAVPSLSVRFDFIRPVGIFTGNRTCSFTVQEAVTGTVVLSEMTQMSTSICGDGIVDDTEPCDPFAPATPCCSEDCFGPAPGWQPCGADPDGDGCQAAPTCDGSGWNASACEASLVPDGIPCTDDSLFCTGAEICQSGNCQSSGNPCPGPNGNANCAESCNEVAETCSAPDPDGSPCDDGLLCAGDACQGGACIPDLTCL
jgi:hypothetical protein